MVRRLVSMALPGAESEMIFTGLRRIALGLRLRRTADQRGQQHERGQPNRDRNISGHGILPITARSGRERRRLGAVAQGGPHRPP